MSEVHGHGAPRAQGDLAAAGGTSWAAGRDDAAPLRGRKIAEVLARGILAEVALRRLVPGDRLPSEAEMMRSYGTGRATLREALRLLEVHGLIRVKPGPGGGPVLGAPTPADLGGMTKLHLQIAGATYGELLDARLALEPLMARLAAAGAGRRRLRHLEEAVALADASDMSDDEAFRTAMYAFHRTVSASCGNRVLDLLAEALREVYHGRVRAELIPRSERDRLREVHRSIAAAVIEGRGEDAERLMGEHMVEYADHARRTSPAVLDEVVVWD